MNLLETAALIVFAGALFVAGCLALGSLLADAFFGKGRPRS